MARLCFLQSRNLHGCLATTSAACCHLDISNTIVLVRFRPWLRRLQKRWEVLLVSPQPRERCLASMCCAQANESMAEAEAALKPALEAIDAGRHKLEKDLQDDFLLRFSAAWVHTSMATLGVSILEKQKRHCDACELLRKLLGGNLGTLDNITCKDSSGLCTEPS